MNTSLISGLHHVTALAADPQQNVDFYAGVLGLRLVKKTINFDAPEVYHLYYGDEAGSPGTIMTFFPYKSIHPGRKGKGMLNTTAFAIDPASIGYWEARLKQFGIAYKGPQDRFEEAFISFEDPDGLGLELVTVTADDRPGYTQGHIPEQHAIKGFQGVTLWEEGYERTAGVLTEQLNHKLLREGSNRFRFVPDGTTGNCIDILCMPDALPARGGSGTVHHVAFATATDASQLQVRQKVAERGLNVTPVIDRNYFHSIYFREPGGVLFEVATNPPGFAVDELASELGQNLKLPAWLEPHRVELERVLTPVTLDISKYK